MCVEPGDVAVRVTPAAQVMAQHNPGTRPSPITSRECSHSGGLSSATEAGSAWHARGVW